jgi:hypothetical protein
VLKSANRLASYNIPKDNMFRALYLAQCSMSSQHLQHLFEILSDQIYGDQQTQFHPTTEGEREININVNTEARKLII